jgi:molybdopterin converting factor small subunit
MSVKVLFFGATADATGTKEQMMDPGESVEACIEGLIRSYPSLSRHKLLVAVNEEYAEPQSVLKDGDEVAVFTAVSGG